MIGGTPPGARPTGLVRRGDGARLAVAAGAVLLVALMLGWLGWTAARQSAFFDGDRFNIVRWEATTFLNKWLYFFGEPLRDDPPDDEALARYFAASSGIARIEREAGGAPTAGQAAELARLREERGRMENHVEAIIERRISAVLAGERLKTGLPFPLPDPVWPPVDFELTAALRVLAESPRDRIDLTRSDLLNNSLSAEEAFELERNATTGDRVAVVLQTGGVAAYPSIVDEAAGYDDMVRIAAHEWIHQYLFFHPLGRRYFSRDLRSVNETVATIAAGDIVALVEERFPGPVLSAAPSAPAARSSVDSREVLRELRRDVDSLLAQGRVEEAERLMEDVRLELERRGVYIRLINQAYFAYYGLYATSAAAAGDLGLRLQALRERTGSLGEFIRAVRGVSSTSDLEAVLSAP